MPAPVRKKRKKSTKPRKPRGGQVVAEVAAQYGIKTLENPKEKLLAPKEAGAVLGVTGEAVKQWIYRGLLPANKLGNGYWRIKVADLETFVRKRENTSLKTILIAGADYESIKLRALQVQRENIEILLGHGLADAVLKASNNRPSVFIVDLTEWPDGWNFIERIREYRSSQNTSILLLKQDELDSAQINRAMALKIQSFISNKSSAEHFRKEVFKLVEDAGWMS